MTLQEYITKYQGKFIGKYGKTCSKVESVEPFCGQCVSNIAYWLSIAGNNYPVKPRGNAKDWINLERSKRINQVDLRNGDLVVWTGGGYGHIGIWYNNMVFSQNPHKLRLDKLTYFNSWNMGSPVFIRPEYKDTSKLNLKAPTKGRYQTTDVLNIRKGAGTNYDIKQVRDVTADARTKMVYSALGANAVLRKGVLVDVLEVKRVGSTYWGRIPSGWVSMDYLKKV